MCGGARRPRLRHRVKALDYSRCPDCRPELLDAFERLVAFGTKVGGDGVDFRIFAPLVNLSKTDVVRRGTALGVDAWLTRSCYDVSPDGRPYGRCGSCGLRASGFADAGLVDPVIGC